MRARQCDLVKGDQRLTAWIDDRKGIRFGTVVTLRDLEGLWRVERVGRVVVDTETINRRWNVGGLF
jgi:hypothetical protein